MLTKFVSNSVTGGLLTGIAALILMGQLWDLTGYSGEGGSKLEQTAQLLGDPSEVDPATTFFGFGSIALMVALGYSPKVSNFNLLIALGVAILVQVIFGFDSVAMAGDVPRGLPSLEIPTLSVVPVMLLAGIATGAVELLQAAGVAQAFPIPDGTDISDSRDFSAQGMANVATSFFQGMAGGGSLSGTALNVSAGARTRYAAIVQAGVVLVFILVFAGLLARIPSAALTALLVYAAALSVKRAAIATVSRTSLMSLAAIVLTLASTLVVPLQQAVIFGVVVASVLFICRSSTDVRLFNVSVQDGHLVHSELLVQLPGNQVTVIDVEGNLFCAGMRTLSGRLADAAESHHVVAVL
jgi:SulP family sulfate permease